MGKSNQSDLVIHIPETSRIYPLAELPVTNHLRNIFARLGLKTIADFTPANLDWLLETRGVGIRTLNDLIYIVERIEKGEFRPVRLESLNDLSLAEILSDTDEAMLTLWPRHQQLIELRYGAVPGKPRLTLEQVAAQFDRTRQTVHIMQRIALDRLRRALGAYRISQLNFLTEKCLEAVVLFDVNLLKHLLDSSPVSSKVKMQYWQRADYY